MIRRRTYRNNVKTTQIARMHQSIDASLAAEQQAHALSPRTLTTAQAQTLYEQHQAIREGPHTITTRTAAYDWNEDLQCYERILEGLRVAHRTGVKWHARQRCFVPCFCDACNARSAEELAEIELYER